MGRRRGTRPAAGLDGGGRPRDDGQVLVLFALSLVVLLAFAGLAFDIGRFYTERRFLQNAADAAALAAANALIRGESTTTADSEARDVLTRNLAGDPTGRPASLPPTTPEYEPGHAGDPTYLLNGILITGSDVRVALKNPVDYTFGRVVGLNTTDVGARAKVGWMGNILPVAVRRFVKAPGPSTNISPCTNDQTQFMAFFSTADTACLGTDSDSALRTDPSAGMAFDSVNPGADSSEHGPIVTILGQGAQPDNGADFRGFISLDIRNFATDLSQLYYNDVTAGTNSNTLKAMEANWITLGGYPGPMFPPATTPPDANDQVGMMSGNDTGIAIDEVNNRFALGEEVLVAVYPGVTMAIPDFSMTPPAAIALPTTGTVVNAGSLKVAKNQAFTGTVTLSTLSDSLDPQNPMVTGALQGGSDPVTYTPNPVTPSQGSGTTVSMTNMTTSGATAGIYTLWIQGQAGSPYLTVKKEPFAINVGGVSRDFTFTSSSSVGVAPNPGDTVSFTLNLRKTGANFGNPVTLSVDTPLPSGVGAITLSPSSVTPAAGNGTDSTLTINTGTMAPGAYDFVVRASGMNGDSPSHKVTHLLRLTVYVATAASNGGKEYVDIDGFAVMRIVSMDSNHVDAYAITPVIADMADERLRRGQVAKLVPWD